MQNLRGTQAPIEKEATTEKSNKVEVTRPEHEVELLALWDEIFHPTKVQDDPTDDLVTVPVGMSDSESYEWFSARLCEDGLLGIKGNTTPFLVVCSNTREAWYAKDESVLNANFIYRNDLRIERIDTLLPGVAPLLYREVVSKYDPDVVLKKTCYLLDNPCSELYEVYYNPAYPVLRYGKSTPSGMFVHKYKNRFHRDMAILQLDKLYSESSKSAAKNMTKREMGEDEAVIISDGCWLSNTCACTCFYMDNSRLIKLSEGFLPSDDSQAVLIAEISGAINALNMCRARVKKRITYYYDNSSIVNVFRNRKLEYISEIVEYKKLLESMDEEGYSVTFVELHPKATKDKEDANKALVFFHNCCDSECRDISSLFSKSYRDVAINSEKEGRSFKQVKEDFKPRQKPRQNNNKNRNKNGGFCNGIN